MRVLAWFALATLVLTAPANSRELLAEAPLGTETVLIFNDGFWRFSDAEGERCTPVAFVGEVCALPSIWAPVPVPLANRTRPEFVQGTDFLSKVTSLTPLSDDRPITLSDIRAFIQNQAMNGPLRGTFHRPEPGEIDGFVGQTIPVTRANGGVVLFTVVFQKDRAIIARTSRPDSTLVTNDLRDAHAQFLAAIKLENR